MRAEWTVVVEPKGSNGDPGGTAKGGKNKGGLIIFLTDGESKEEVTRVGYARPDTRNPDVTFDAQLEIELEKAHRACDVINDYLDEQERAQAEAFEKVKDTVREILGPAPRANMVPN